MNANELRSRLSNAAFAFRGYNIHNLGRSRELLNDDRYSAIVKQQLDAASDMCSSIVNRPVDLVARVMAGEETTLESYDEAIALIMAMEAAHLQILRERWNIEYQSARVALGYSLGELAALAASEVIEQSEIIRIPLTLAADCVSLAHDTTLGILFSRVGLLSEAVVHKLCQEINLDGQGVMGISSILSPNSMLLMGQGDTLQRFRARMAQAISAEPILRLNHERWPPLHTPIMWQCGIPNRAAKLMHTMRGGFVAPKPPILSLVTGKTSYTDSNARELLHRWSDHPQRLWDAVYQLLVMGIDTIIHVGPAPNIIPATFRRLSDNVLAQTRGNFGMRALSGMAQRGWVRALLPQRTALLRAPIVQNIILEDWLLDEAPK